MSKLNKIKNGEYIGGDKYTITPDAGGKSRVVFSPDNILTEPTPVGAEILNEMQLNQVYTLDTTRSVDGQKEVYIATLEGFTEFDSPDLSFNLKINSENTNSQTYLRLNGIDYLIECKIGNLKAGSIVYAKKVNSLIKVIGNKNFGVVEGDILEGHRMAQIQGVEKFGGDVQTAGTKKVGYAYWCTVNKDMYICKVENSLNYIDASYFEAFSNNALLGKLNNLSNFGECIILARIEIDNNNLVVGSSLSAPSSEDVNNFRFLSFVLAENPSNLEDCLFIGIKTPSDKIGFSSMSDAMYELSVTTTKTFALTTITNTGNNLCCHVYRDLDPNSKWADHNNFLLMLGYR